MRGDCPNVEAPCEGDWTDHLDSLCAACRIERECALIDAAMMRDTPEPVETV